GIGATHHCRGADPSTLAAVIAQHSPAVRAFEKRVIVRLFRGSTSFSARRCAFLAREAAAWNRSHLGEGARHGDYRELCLSVIAGSAPRTDSAPDTTFSIRSAGPSRRRSHFSTPPIGCEKGFKSRRKGQLFCASSTGRLASPRANRQNWPTRRYLENGQNIPARLAGIPLAARGRCRMGRVSAHISTRPRQFPDRS